MYLPRIPFPIFIFIFISTISATDYTTLVYKGCAKQPLPDPSFSQSISSLFATLVPQSSKSKFSKATTQTTPAITALFQCRADLSGPDCYACVSRLPKLITKHCGRAVAARVQLLGCYMLYEDSGFAQISGMQMLYKKCSGPSANGPGFVQSRDSALSAAVNGVSGGFFAGGVGGVYVVVQCEGDVGASDCVECVKNGAGRVKGECGGSAGGQVYLHKCFVGYSYYPNGVPKRSSSSSSGPNTGKTVAIILGGAAGVGFLVICLLFTKGLFKKKMIIEIILYMLINQGWYILLAQNATQTRKPCHVQGTANRSSNVQFFSSIQRRQYPSRIIGRKGVGFLVDCVAFIHHIVVSLKDISLGMRKSCYW